MDHQKIHLAVTKKFQEKPKCHYSEESLKEEIAGNTLVAHNGIGFDFPVLNKLWNMKIKLNQVMDTLVLSRLLNPQRGKHSLSVWGKTLGFPKIEFNDFDNYSKEMEEYCIRDVELLEVVYKELDKEKNSYGFSEKSIKLEHQVYAIVKKQVDKGFKINSTKCKAMVDKFKERTEHIRERLSETFKPIITKRISEKTKKRLKDDIEIFNPASRQQIAKRLQGLGWQPKKKTEKGSIIIDEQVLATIDFPEARLLEEYLLIQKRLAQVESWIKHTNDRNRVCGQVVTNGAVTGRFTHHSPNLGQVPSVNAPYGKECREVWVVDEGKKLVGIDASGLELRMLAHYMNDPVYTKEVVDGDIHSKNQKLANLDTRAKAKTFIYAFLYGAGSYKLGQITGKKGNTVVNDFLDNLPALASLKERIANNLEKKETLRGLDGRRLFVRSSHSALNTLLQSAGAIVMKEALVIFNKYLKLYELEAEFVANVHDEWQLEATEEDAEMVGEIGVKAIIDAGKSLELRCPLDAEFKIGNNWKETH